MQTHKLIVGNLLLLLKTCISQFSLHEFVLNIGITKIIISRKNWAGHAACMGEDRREYLRKI
jgi:hypothetical protein